MLRTLTILTAMVAGISTPLAAGEFVDYGTQHQLLVPTISSLSSGAKFNTVQLHICGGGAVMRGAHVGANQFLCAETVQLALGNQYVDLPVTVSFSSITSNIERGFKRYQDFRFGGIASCPPMHVMVGMHVGDNLLACAPVRPQAYRSGANLGWETFLDFRTNERVGNTFMHTCPPGSLMVGIHVDRNVFVCGRYTIPGS